MYRRFVRTYWWPDPYRSAPEEIWAAMERQILTSMAEGSYVAIGGFQRETHAPVSPAAPVPLSVYVLAESID